MPSVPMKWKEKQKSELKKAQNKNKTWYKRQPTKKKKMLNMVRIKLIFVIRELSDCASASVIVSVSSWIDIHSFGYTVHIENCIHLTACKRSIYL